MDQLDDTGGLPVPPGWPEPHVRRTQFPAVVTPYAALPVPTREQAEAWGEALTRCVMWRRELTVYWAKADPFRYGCSLSSWERAEAQWSQTVRELLLMGGNRSGKSEYAARELVRVMVDKPGARVWAFQTTGPNSVEMQQPYVHKYLPSEWRNVPKTKVANVSYSQKGGFTENTFVLPNGSQCWFRNYAQDLSTIEGGEIDFAWCDELVPLEFLETIRFRLVTRNGRLLVTFTPIEGYSATVKEYLSGARTLEEIPAELLPKDAEDAARGFERVPLVQQTTHPGRRIVYFHTKENPFAGYDRLKLDLVTERRDKILCRAYGVPTKALANRFPKFNTRVHVVPANRLPKWNDLTWYHVVDPCNGRNFFMIWAAVRSDGRCVVAREWPQPADYIEGIGLPGEWAVPSGKREDGDPGPAQKPFGFGLRRYAEEIRRVERELGALTDVPDGNPIHVQERIMDSRYGNAPTLAKSEATTLIDEFAELEDENGEAIGLDFIPAPGNTIDEGTDLINDWLDYDPTQEVTSLNQPKLFVVEDCGNVIYALSEWTGRDGNKGACKDPVDVMRYLVLSDPVPVSEMGAGMRHGGSW